MTAEVVGRKWCRAVSDERNTTKNRVDRDCQTGRARNRLCFVCCHGLFLLSWTPLKIFQICRFSAYLGFILKAEKWMSAFNTSQKDVGFRLGFSWVLVAKWRESGQGNVLTFLFNFCYDWITKKFKENFSICKKLAYWGGLIETEKQKKRKQNFQMCRFSAYLAVTLLTSKKSETFLGKVTHSLRVYLLS